MTSSRAVPNILVVGTPGTGKSTLCELVAAASGGMLRHVDLGKLVREKGLHSGYDAEYDCFTLDEDKVCDELEDVMESGGVVLEAHSCDYFPERWFDLVVVLRANNTVLYDRLSTRGYARRKLEENVEAEIMQVVLDEARASYAHGIIRELRNETIEELEANSQTILAWLHEWPAPSSLHH
jgi:adenylate kinase